MDIYHRLLIALLSLLAPLIALLTLRFLGFLSPNSERIGLLLRTSKRYVLFLAIAWSISVVSVYLVIATGFCLGSNVCTFGFYFPGVPLVMLSNIFSVVLAAYLAKKRV